MLRRAGAGFPCEHKNLSEPDLSPLDVLLRLMRGWLRDGKLKEAADAAKAAAPYVHSRAAADEGRDDIATMKDHELAALHRSGAARAGITPAAEE
jgi:hypothetical protein